MRRVVLLACAAGATSSIACSSLSRAHVADPNVPVPDSFLVRFETSKGSFDVLARKAWSPVGVDRFYTLVEDRFYDRARFFRAVPNFVVQWGLSADPTITAAWRQRLIADDPVKHTNARGTISYARGGAGTRSVQLFINLKDNARLDTLNGFGFPPIAEVVRGMEVVDSLYTGYGDAAPRTGPVPGKMGPGQDSIGRFGEPYLAKSYPKLDLIKTARVIREWRK